MDKGPHTFRITIIKKTRTNKVLLGMWRKGNPCVLLVSM